MSTKVSRATAVSRKPQSLILSNGERHYSLTELAKLLPDKPHRRTVWRWCKSGMEYFIGTNGRRSSVEAYHRFMELISTK
jgi:hypothetical protein